jgi:predicted HD superfamily hydrolase involved in NAD metabolism
LTAQEPEIAVIAQWMKTQVSPERYEHVRGVVRASLKLASRYQVDRKKAELAAWLHDCAKELSRESMLGWLRGSSMRLDSMERCMPGLWHPHAGAAIALRKWKIRDRSVLEAIRCHTLGRPGMDPLAQVLFVADFIEPGRNFTGVRRARQLTRKSLAEGVRVKASMTIRNLLEKGMMIHPRLMDTWNAFLRKDSA